MADAVPLHSRKLSALDTAESVSIEATADGPGLQVLHLAAGSRHEALFPEAEVCVLVLCGTLIVEVGDGERSWTLDARANVFDGTPEALLLSPGTPLRLEARTGTEVALAWAETGPQESSEPLRLPSKDVHAERARTPVGVLWRERVLTPGRGSRRLVVQEVLMTPASVPHGPLPLHPCEDPHACAGETIGYYRLETTDCIAYHRVGEHEAPVAVRNGDVVRLPLGRSPLVHSPECSAYLLLVGAVARDSKAD